MAVARTQVFGPAFRRNTRWSVDKNVPDVGDDTSSWEDVTKFYDFWYTFKSWREFPHPEEEELEAAESREHRRWMERCVLLLAGAVLLLWRHEGGCDVMVCCGGVVMAWCCRRWPALAQGHLCRAGSSTRCLQGCSQEPGEHVTCWTAAPEQPPRKRCAPGHSLTCAPTPPCLPQDQQQAA
jgi:hypothetical protein